MSVPAASSDSTLLRYLIDKTQDHGLALFRASFRDPGSTYWRELLQAGMMQRVHGQAGLTRDFFATLAWSCGDFSPARAVECLRATLTPLKPVARRRALGMKSVHADDSVLFGWIQAVARVPREMAASLTGDSAVAQALVTEAIALDAVDYAATRNYRLRRGGSVAYTPLQAALVFSDDASADWLLAHGAPLDQRAQRTLLGKELPTANVLKFLERNRLSARVLEPEFAAAGASPETVQALRALLARDAARDTLRQAPAP